MRWAEQNGRNCKSLAGFCHINTYEQIPCKRSQRQTEWGAAHQLQRHTTASADHTEALNNTCSDRSSCPALRHSCSLCFRLVSGWPIHIVSPLCLFLSGFKVAHYSSPSDSIVLHGFFVILFQFFIQVVDVYREWKIETQDARWFSWLQHKTLVHSATASCIFPLIFLPNIDISENLGNPTNM